MPKLGEIVKISEDRNKPKPTGQPSWLDRRNPDYGQAAETIRQYIDQNPGARAVKIAHDTGVSISTVSSTLHRYVKSGRTKKRLQDGYTRYYPANYRFSDERIIAEPAPQVRHDAKATILDYIRSHPGATSNELKTIGLKTGTVSGTPGRLVKQGELSRTEKNGLWHYYLEAPKPEVKSQFVMPIDRALDIAPPQFAVQVESAAKDFFWQQQSDSLREFVKYIKEQQ